MLSVFKYIGIGLLGVLGVSLTTLNLDKIHKGCPVGQILIISVATHVCIRQ